MQLITQQNELDALCQQLAQQSHLAVDTEFIREKTYWPELCLIQVSWDPALPDVSSGRSRGGAAAIDTLADLDLTPFLEILSNPSITKIFHAARQDLEIFYRLMGTLPAPIVDTQIMALALGHAEQMGYEALVRTVLRRNLAKGQQFTDWKRRPLTDKQLEYAIGDVTHLLDAYHIMAEQLAGRTAWLADEYAALLDIDNYEPDINSLWQRVKVRSNDPAVLGRLRAIAAWRETESQRKNLPRGWVMKDEALAAIAQNNPKNADALRNVRGTNGLKDQHITALLEAMASAQPIHLPRPDNQNPAPKAVIKLLQVLLEHIAEEQSLHPRLIANASDLNDFALGKTSILDNGWRHDIFGQAARGLLAGDVMMGIRDGRLDLRAINS